MQTILNLLTRHGVVYMAFQPHLAPEQYAELLKLQETADGADEMRELIRNWATARKLEVSFEE